MARIFVDRVGDAHSFIARAAFVLQWGDLSGATVMDIGCGSGCSSRALILNFPNIARVIAFDKSADRLAVAMMRNADPRIEYVMADMEKRSTLAPWIGQIEKAVSVYCLNCLQNMRLGYENLFLMLKPGGEVAILQSISSPYMDFLEELINSPKWSDIAPTLTLTGAKLGGDEDPLRYFRRMVQDIGFEVIQCFKQMETFTFNCERECKDAVFRTLSLVMIIPDRGRDELKDDAYRMFIRHNPYDEEGNRTMTHCSMVALLRKPSLMTG